MGVDKSTENVSEKQKPLGSSLELIGRAADPEQETSPASAVLYRSVVLEASDVVATASVMLTVGVLNWRTAKAAHKTSAPYGNGRMRT